MSPSELFRIERGLFALEEAVKGTVEQGEGIDLKRGDGIRGVGEVEFFRCFVR